MAQNQEKICLWYEVMATPFQITRARYEDVTAQIARRGIRQRDRDASSGRRKN
ncbi:MAG: hypothetical protein IJT77_07080 [Clostridia bacterium]|nr:hypothetical protein [Clostridia bacterium]